MDPCSKDRRGWLAGQAAVGGGSAGKDVQSKVLGSVVPLTGGFLNRADRGTGTHHPLTFPSPMSDEEKTYSSWRAIPTAW